MMHQLQFDISSLHAAYRADLTPDKVLEEVWRRIDAVADPGIFICLEDRARLLEQVARLGSFDAERMPLWGIPFAVKDNIDAATLPTTAACPAFTYNPEGDAFCVARLREAGALMIGKTNLDQFATGLVGVRTPYPVPRNAIDPAIVPGGSSSGSAVAVAHGIVSFALGTDTAGSGRVPAGLNNIVGLKPTLGTVSNTGVVPACRTLDTVSVLALNVGDANAVFRQINCHDQEDAYARHYPTRAIGAAPPAFQVAIPDDASRRFYGDDIQARSFEAAVSDLESIGATVVAIDFTPFYEVAELLYAGSWVAERHAVLQNLLASDPDAVHPVTRQVVQVAEKFSATDAFNHFYRAAEIKSAIRSTLEQVDLMCVPTTPTFYTAADLAEDPIGPNARLGTYTNFVNILDMCALAVPTRAREDGRPGSVTLLASAGCDAELADIGVLLHEKSGATAGATPWPITTTPPGSTLSSDEIALTVVGAHMSGLPLNSELTRLGARFLERTTTAPAYRLYALAGGPPMRPGLVRAEDGQCIEVETWALPKTQFGAFIEGVPQPLGIGTLELVDGRQVKGFICEAAGLSGAEDITSYGGWRSFTSAG